MFIIHQPIGGGWTMRMPRDSMQNKKRKGPGKKNLGESLRHTQDRRILEEQVEDSEIFQILFHTSNQKYVCIYPSVACKSISDIAIHIFRFHLYLSIYLSFNGRSMEKEKGTELQELTHSFENGLNFYSIKSGFSWQNMYLYNKSYCWPLLHSELQLTEEASLWSLYPRKYRCSNDKRLVEGIPISFHAWKENFQPGELSALQHCIH